MIAATVLGSGMAQLDSTVVGIALPTIGRQFHTGISALQWVVTAYALALAGLLLLGGALGDRLGRQRVFVVGTIWFAVASLGCGVAPSATVLIVARGLQGVGAALLTPGSLAILQASFSTDDRSKAIGAWSGLGGVAAAIGPFLGGWLISAVSWRLIFFINLPIAVAVVAITARHVPESRDPERTGRLDYGGAALVTCGLVGVVYGLIEGPGLGWQSPVILVALFGGVAALGLFGMHESRRAHPLMPLGMFRSLQFSSANAVTFAVYAGLGAALFLLPVELQQVSGYSPLGAGAALLPVTAIMLVLSARSGGLAARIGPRLQMSLGPLIAGAGLALLARVGVHGGYVSEVLPAVTVLGLGLAVTVAPLTSTVLAAAPPEHAGVASAINNDVARSASLVAVAFLPAVTGITGDSYLHPARFSHSFHNSVLLAGAICAAGGVLAVFTTRNPRRPAFVATPASATDAVRQYSHCALDATPLRGGAPPTMWPGTAPRDGPPIPR